MTNEIKELLFLLHNDRLTESGKRKLEDYITNLQEENKELKDKLKWYENIDPNNTIDKFRLEQNMKVKNLHKRIDKAIEYTKRYWQKSFLLGTWEFFGSGDELLDILRGDE